MKKYMYLIMGAVGLGGAWIASKIYYFYVQTKPKNFI
jgi:hypothetical protein